MAVTQATQPSHDLPLQEVVPRLDSFSTTSLGSPQSVISDHATIRPILWSSFLEFHVPKDCGLQWDQFSFFKVCMEVSATHAPLLHALDTLSLVQLGSVNNDRRLLDKAGETYAEALRGLNHALSTRGSLYDDHILATIMVLRFCELYTELASPKGIGWAEHIRGAQTLFAIRGPASIQSDLALSLFTNARQGALCHALLARRASTFAQPGWRAVVPRTRLQDASSAINEIAIQIPGVLEQYDHLNPQHKDYVDSIDDIIAEAAHIEVEMRSWLHNWVVAGFHYETRPIHDFTYFASVCADRTFDTAYMFTNFTIAYLYSTYWTCMYVLRITIRALYVARATASQDYVLTSDNYVDEEEILGYITNLCQCIPYFCEPASSSTGCIGMFLPLRTAAHYFVEHGMRGRARWISNVRNTVLDKGLEPPSVDDIQLRHCADYIVGQPDWSEAIS